MNEKCAIVRDLLPSYLDDLCSEESKNYIEAHVKNCNACKEVLTTMKDNAIELPNEIEVTELKHAKKPFKKIKNRMILLVTTLIIVFTSIFVFMIQKGEFEKWHHSTFDRNMMNDKEIMYLGNYLLSWNGYGNPTIEDIYFIQKDGTVLREGNEQLSFTPYIDLSNTIAVVDEAHVEEEGLEDDLISTHGYQAKDGKYNLAFKVHLKDKNYNSDVHTIVVEYSHFGIKKKQEIGFEGFFHESEE